MKKNINKIVKKVINEAVPLKNFNFDGNGNMSYEQEKPKFSLNTDTGDVTSSFSNRQNSDTNDFTSSYSGDENMNGLNSNEQNNVQPQQNAEPVQNNKTPLKQHEFESSWDYDLSQYVDFYHLPKGSKYKLVQKNIGQEFKSGPVSTVHEREYNICDENEQPISNIWFKDVDEFHKHSGWILVSVKDKGWNYINLNGNFLSNTWYSNAENFKTIEGVDIACVKVNGKGWNVIDANGNILMNKWFVGMASLYAKNYISCGTKFSNRYDCKLFPNGDLFDDENNFIENISLQQGNYNESIDRIVSEVLNEVRQRKMNEEGCGGATSCGGVGVDGNNTINVPMGKVQRRKIYSPKNEDLIRDSKELNEVKSMMSRLNKIK